MRTCEIPESEIPPPPPTLRPTALELEQQEREEQIAIRAARLAVDQIASQLGLILEGQHRILEALERYCCLEQRLSELEGRVEALEREVRGGDGTLSVAQL